MTDLEIWFLKCGAVFFTIYTGANYYLTEDAKKSSVTAPPKVESSEAPSVAKKAAAEVIVTPVKPASSPAVVAKPSSATITEPEVEKPSWISNENRLSNEEISPYSAWRPPSASSPNPSFSSDQADVLGNKLSQIRHLAQQLGKTAEVAQVGGPAEKGNSLQVCIAHVLKKNIEEVPNFILAENPYDSLTNYLAQFKLGLVKIQPPFVPSVIKHPLKCIVAGKSPRGDFKHCVVGEWHLNQTEPKLVYDPIPTNLFLENIQWVGVLVALI